jgi:uncharacterized protein YeeX (DUF496 family)
MIIRESFTYERTWYDIETMLDKAEKRLNFHTTKFAEENCKERMHHAKQLKALQGVCKTLRWTLGDKQVEHPLE